MIKFQHLNKIFAGLLTFCLALGFASCDKTYELPPLNEPTFTLPSGAQTITIKELRTRYANATQENPMTIADSLWLKARVSGDDRSGNIFKQIILQDETGGISFLIDQSNVYNDYPTGQEVYISLKGLCVSVYGDEQQLGYPTGTLYRTPYVNFKKHVHRNGYADPAALKIKAFSDISKLSDDVAANKFTLVRLNGVHFKEGGKANFAEKKGVGAHDLVDEFGNTISVRTSNYAAFAATQLPVGTGNVIAILGRFRGAWQLTIRNIEDVFGFDGIAPTEPPVTPPSPDETIIFFEKMGNSKVTKEGNYWPLVSKFTAWSNPNLSFTDVNSTLSVRNWSDHNCIWFPSGKTNDFKIAGFDTSGYKKLTLTYKVNANLYNDGDQMDLAAMTGTFNGVAFATPSKVVAAPADKNEFTLVTIDLPVASGAANSELHFLAGEANKLGLRLAEIKLTGKK